MAGKKHPILSVLLILVAAVVFLGVAMAAILSIFGPSSGLSFGERIGVIKVEGTIVDSEPILNQLV